MTHRFARVPRITKGSHEPSSSVAYGRIASSTYWEDQQNDESKGPSTRIHFPGPVIRAVMSPPSHHAPRSVRHAQLAIRTDLIGQRNSAHRIPLVPLRNRNPARDLPRRACLMFLLFRFTLLFRFILLFRCLRIGRTPRHHLTSSDWGSRDNVGGRGLETLLLENSMGRNKASSAARRRSDRSPRLSTA